MNNRKVYEVLECDTIQELQKQVETRLAMGATLVGGVATAAVWQPDFKVGDDSHRGQPLQLFYQAVTYKVEDTPGDATTEAINKEVGVRVEKYQKYWNPKTGMYEIDKGDEQKEWICTEDQLYDDVRRSVIDERKYE